ncbi:MAG: heterodisulfide reductase [Calditrichaeota bacterium]|nr:MAG: heterodisulfide reductase [Calditrichota bacterium]
MKVQRKVKYESELDPSFAKWVASVPGGENIRECIQCGTCSSICPLSVYMDITPRRLIAMADAGFKKEILSSFTIWLCSSCYSCAVNCPRDIRITDVMYAFKRRAMEEGYAPSRKFAIPILARAFADMVKKNGRTTESRLVMTLAWKAGISRLLRMTPLGWKLLRTGRMHLKKDKVQNRQQIRKIFQVLEAKA